jgi:hypothetical protein
VFDLVGAGVRRATPIAKAGGMGIDAARDPLASLVEAGLVIRNGLDHYIAPDAVAVADQSPGSGAASCVGCIGRSVSAMSVPGRAGTRLPPPKRLTTTDAAAMRTRNSCGRWACCSGLSPRNRR